MGFSILVVDDELNLRKAVSRLLTKAGYDTAEAESVDQAVALHRARRYDLLVLDIALPDGSGVDVLANPDCAQAAIGTAPRTPVRNFLTSEADFHA